MSAAALDDAVARYELDAKVAQYRRQRVEQRPSRADVLRINLAIHRCAPPSKPAALLPRWELDLARSADPQVIA